MFVSLRLPSIVATIGFFMVDFLMVDLAERLLLPWHVSQRARRQRPAGRA
jgi:hypothetical protein